MGGGRKFAAALVCLGFFSNGLWPIQAWAATFLLALAAGVSWAAGTVYLKWARLDGDPQEVLKFDQNGKILMMLGKMGVGGKGTDTFDRPTGVAIAANGDIFVSDGHGGNASNNARVLKFSKYGRFIKTWGHQGSAPGDFDDPHDIAIGGSMGRVYVADRRNSRVQVFDQDGN